VVGIYTESPNERNWRSGAAMRPVICIARSATAEIHGAQTRRMTQDEPQSITAEIAGRLDLVLRHHVTDLSRARLQKLISEGAVKVGGSTVTDTNHKVSIGTDIVLTIPEAEAASPESENIPLTIVFEDRDLLVIDKPAGMVVHPGAGRSSGTLVNALLAHCGDSLSGIGGVKRPGIVHRLDKDTSGLLVVAKNDMTHQNLSDQFAAHGRDGKMEREYLAFVWGTPPRQSGRIETGIARSSSNRQKMSVSGSASAKRAITHYEIIEKFDGTSLIRCKLETGRTHQIRVHMAHVGNPLLGDTTYGGGFKSAESRLETTARTALKGLKGQALHATILGFEHPRSKRQMRFESPLPRNLASLHKALKRER
jgi:23S rRNA pseudouridine1911/1915/1917 synthase